MGRWISSFWKSMVKYDIMKRVKRTSSFCKSMSKYDIMKRVKRKKTVWIRRLFKNMKELSSSAWAGCQKEATRDQVIHFKQSYCCVISACTKILKGLHFVLPCTEKLTAIDLRTQVFDVVPQEVNDLLFHRKIIFVNIAHWLENAGSGRL